mmetsp:Transcript_9367/g.13880  ORF Transcript_9367/g.13880 Transcript_9367/m.13880 type:complete len:382 (+) Transcript_9367:144-1289(+)
MLSSLFQIAMSNSSPTILENAFPITGQFVNQITQSAPIVGFAWIASSIFYTTYSTTSFLKYKPPSHNIILPHYHRKSKNKFRHSSTSITSSASKTSAKIIANRPALLTLYRFGGSLLLGLILPNPFAFAIKWQRTFDLLPSFVLPALFLFMANYFNSISLDRLGISLTYTTKCGIPLFTVLMSILVNGKGSMPGIGVWVSMVPIVVGIACASWNSPTFELLGFISALVSCTSQSALNVLSKKVLKDVKVSGVEAQRVMVSAALGFMLILTAFSSLTTFKSHTSREERPSPKLQKQVDNHAAAHPPLPLTTMAITAYHFEYVLSFLYVSLTEPITYALCDAMRRLGIILCGKAMFGGDKLSGINKTGIGLAIAGACMYALNK